jgi:hypothetical protein
VTDNPFLFPTTTKLSSSFIFPVRVSTFSSSHSIPALCHLHLSIPFPALSFFKVFFNLTLYLFLLLDKMGCSTSFICLHASPTPMHFAKTPSVAPSRPLPAPTPFIHPSPFIHFRERRFRHDAKQQSFHVIYPSRPMFVLSDPLLPLPPALDPLD